ncbi:MAG TPA: hypothetical protein VI039_03545 [Solirubrobacterales bacterium]
MIRRFLPYLLVSLALVALVIGVFAIDGSGGDETSFAPPICKGPQGKCSWSTQLLPSPGPGTSSDFEDASCPSPAVCVAVGNRQSGGKGFAEIWSGSAWESIGDLAGTVKAISCPTPTRCLAVGNNPPQSWRLERRDTSGDSEWEIRPLSPPQPKSWSELIINDVSCTSGTACLIAGTYWESGYKNYAARWDGSGWELELPPNPKDEVAAPTHGILGLSCASSTFCVTVGAFKLRPFVEHWDGSKWEIVPAPHPEGSPSASLEGVSCTSASACIAVGSVMDKKTRTEPFAERWDGNEWSIVETPALENKGYVLLRSVACLTEGSCLAVGSSAYPAPSTEAEVTVAMTWNGSKWTLQPSPNPKPFSQFAGVSCSARNACIAVGRAGTDWKADAVAAPLAARLR